ncbi:MAG: response regulator [Rhodothermales bacterium]|nr:response regulator [Rhodothermales bacterium]
MRKKALVIENDPTIRECIEVMYEAEGLDVITAPDGEHALELTRQHAPDLIVSDLYLARLSGIDIFEALRADPDTGGIPFMFITADARESVRERCLALGAEAFLLKPFTFDQLMDATHALLGDRSRPDADQPTRSRS